MITASAKTLFATLVLDFPTYGVLNLHLKKQHTHQRIHTHRTNDAFLSSTHRQEPQLPPLLGTRTFYDPLARQTKRKNLGKITSSTTGQLFHPKFLPRPPPSSAIKSTADFRVEMQPTAVTQTGLWQGRGRLRERTALEESPQALRTRHFPAFRAWSLPQDQMLCFAFKPRFKARSSSY